MITGKPGTGKTTLVNDLLDRLSGKAVEVATLVTTRLDAEDLLRMTAYAFGLDPSALHKAKVLQNLMDFLHQQRRRDRRALLIVDEAQDLSVSALEELRLLSNVQVSGQSILQILLIGQESLRDLVRSPEMEQVHQRLVAAWHLEPLGPLETVDYVRHRLVKAGWRGVPEFEPGVLRVVHGFSGGVPRRINLVCSRLLLHGFIEERKLISVGDAESVVAELQQEDLSPLGFAPGSDCPTTSEGSEVDCVADLGAAKIPVDWSRIDQGLSVGVLHSDAPTQGSIASTQDMPQADGPPAVLEVQASDHFDIQVELELDELQVISLNDDASWLDEADKEPWGGPRSLSEALIQGGDAMAPLVAEGAVGGILEDRLVSTSSNPRRWFAGVGLVLAGVTVAIFLFGPANWMPLAEEINQFIRITKQEMRETLSRARILGSEPPVSGSVGAEGMPSLPSQERAAMGEGSAGFSLGSLRQDGAHSSGAELSTPGARAFASEHARLRTGVGDEARSTDAERSPAPKGASPTKPKPSADVTDAADDVVMARGGGIDPP